MQRTRTIGWRRIILEIIPLLVLVLSIIIDQWSKAFFSNLWRENNGDIEVIKDFFYITYTVNTGAAFSFLAGKTWAQTFFKILTCLALVMFSIFYVYAYKRKYTWLKYSLSLVIGGTIGNFIDRIMYNGVVDFVGLIFFGWRFPIFNFADVCMCIGVIMTIIHFLFLDKNAIFRKNGKKKNTDTK